MIGASLILRVCHRWAGASILAATIGIGVQACGGGSKSTGPGIVNNPPTIQSIVAASPIVEFNQTQSIQLTATVSDVETAASALTYEWSAAPANGTFTGTGAQVRWSAPAVTPDVYTIAVTVVETYTADGVTKTNRASSTLQVRYNDLIITGLVSVFLTDFGTFAMTPAQCVRNFSNSCPGKAQELIDVTDNRTNVRIENSTFSVSSITYPSATFADILAPCAFKDVRNADGERGTSKGNCVLTAVNENLRWFLCDSNFRDGVRVVEGASGERIVVDIRQAPYSHP